MKLKAANIKLFNSLTDKKETFKPIKEGKVGMYTCGPTVYGPGHLGHARSYVSFDLLKRVFLYNGYQVKHVLNITDVHDDMIKKAKELDISIRELANRFIPMFKEDLKDLNIIPADEYPRVTDHIEDIIELTKILISKGYAYVQEDGSVYFDVKKFKDYGKLSGIRLNKVKTGTRVETDKYDKANIADFALWKGHEKGEPYWESPWGKGRPGWHVECSVMANKYLGKTIDVHAGAMDLKFPHHENEIAQSEAAYGQRFVNYWIHAGLLEVNGEKMSKSLGNYIEIRDVKKEGIDTLALRYLFLMNHYRSRLNFTWENLRVAQAALDKLKRKISGFQGTPEIVSQQAKIYQQKFLKLINDNLAVPQALALLWEMIENDLVEKEKLGLIKDFDQIFGLDLVAKQEAIKIPEEVLMLAKKREELRRKDKWGKADEIRLQIEKKGFRIEDKKDGFKIWPLD